MQRSPNTHAPLASKFLHMRVLYSPIPLLPWFGRLSHLSPTSPPGPSVMRLAAGLAPPPVARSKIAASAGRSSASPCAKLQRSPKGHAPDCSQFLHLRVLKFGSTTLLLLVFWFFLAVFVLFCSQCDRWLLWLPSACSSPRQFATSCDALIGDAHRKIAAAVLSSSSSFTLSAPSSASSASSSSAISSSRSSSISLSLALSGFSEAAKNSSSLHSSARPGRLESESVL
mmetsp:Transcript_39308/g.80519  ORF Transcript_39308/g.80519 Transcript_39308/m.80519 type:complete len:228 (+) Transcript_39308:328-1011(+)